MEVLENRRKDGSGWGSIKSETFLFERREMWGNEARRVCLEVWRFIHAKEAHFELFSGIKYFFHFFLNVHHNHWVWISPQTHRSVSWVPDKKIKLCSVWIYFFIFLFFCSIWPFGGLRKTLTLTHKMSQYCPESLCNWIFVEGRKITPNTRRKNKIKNDTFLCEILLFGLMTLYCVAFFSSFRRPWM